MNRVAQAAFPGAHVGIPPAYEMLKEEHEVGVLGASQSPAPVTTTVINIRMTIVFIIIFATGSLMIFQAISQIVKEYGGY
nr:interferon-induced transmembrane protein 3-like [Vicugna pacos]